MPTWERCRSGLSCCRETSCGGAPAVNLVPAHAELSDVELRVDNLSNALPGLQARCHEFQVPLDHAAPQGEEITLFGREVVAPDAPAGRPWLVFLQGGPGFGAPRPVAADGWLGVALRHYRVLLLDQRGTGRSAPLGSEVYGRSTTGAQASILAMFRADSIVRDCEVVRRQLAGVDEPWSVLGQSFGGFCAVCYLSLAPAGLREVYITGGLPPLATLPSTIYQATFRRVLSQNDAYYERYPEDIARGVAIAAALAESDVRLPGGDRLTTRMFQQIGLSLGFHDGHELVHYAIEQAFPAGQSAPQWTAEFLESIERLLPYSVHPIFSVLHEPAYCEGFASRWAAERVRRELPAFSPAAPDKLLFTGEMIFPWMFEEYGALRPLAKVAHRLAERDDWPQLYDPDILSTNEVPAAALVYDEDMYVERAFSLDTARRIRGIKLWTTNEYVHSGLRQAGQVIFERLYGMLHGQV